MTPHILYSCARKAVRLSMECERSSLDFDGDWHCYMMGEARRHRERAAWYLDRRAMLLRQYEIPLEFAA